MDWVLVVAVVFAAWAVVSLTGYERQRQIDRVNAELAARTPAPAELPPPADTTHPRAA